jgi:CHAD domain-containing protein
MKLPKVAVPDLSDGPSAAELLTRGLACSIDRLFENLDHDDHESVHDARVSTRRLRSNLQTFGPLFEGEQQLRRELKVLARLLGEVRDRDVFILRLTREAAAVNALRRVWTRRRRAEWMNLAHYLESGEFERLSCTLATWACTPPLTEETRAPGLEVLSPLIRRRWLRLAAAARQADPDPPTLHRIRILAKRVRYGTELVVPVAGKPAVRFVEGAKRLQDVLGEYRDATIAHGILIEIGRRLPSRHAVTLGELAGIEWARREQALVDWKGAFEALDRRKLTRWM